MSTAKDNEAAIIVGIHNSTGGGGSSVLTASSLRNVFFLPISPLRGVEITTSFFRADRARAQGGVPIEYFGITPDRLYHPTRRDRLENDRDLHEFLGALLARSRRDRRDRLAGNGTQTN